MKRIFNPDIHPERLSRLISAILGEKVTVTAILPSEDVLLKGNSLLIMDIVVRLADNSITTVEIQKIAVAFPAERMSCYSADLLLRQYEQVKNELNKEFTYAAMKKVYTIVIFENTNMDSSSDAIYQVFHAPEVNHTYLHHGKMTFDSGLSLEFLQEFYLISLDVFREVGYAKDNNELTAWLSLLAAKTFDEAEFLCTIYPWMTEIFQEISEYVRKPEEVIGMFSEALKMMDDNMYQYMVDQHMALVKEQKETILEQQEEIQNQQTKLAISRDELNKKDMEIQKQQTEIQNQQTEIQNQQAEILNFSSLTIQLMKSNAKTKDETVSALMASCNLSLERATELVEKFW